MNTAQFLPVENIRYLPMTHITLMNFVVDAAPFHRWFDPKKLAEITFIGDCIDAGFFLPGDMRTKVKVNSPKPPVPVRVVKPGEVKLVHIKRSKSTSSRTDGSGGSGLKGKLSQIMPKWGSKGKEKEVKELDDEPVCEN